MPVAPSATVRFQARALPWVPLLPTVLASARGQMLQPVPMSRLALTLPLAAVQLPDPRPMSKWQGEPAKLWPWTAVPMKLSNQVRV